VFVGLAGGWGGGGGGQGDSPLGRSCYMACWGNMEKTTHFTQWQAELKKKKRMCEYEVCWTLGVVDFSLGADFEKGPSRLECEGAGDLGGFPTKKQT